jgi:hypothetical protein
VKTKSFPATYKSTDTIAQGKADGLAIDASFEAIVSVFDCKDRSGDIVRHGAFTETIDNWAKSGNVLPVLWSHRMDDPAFNIGSVTGIEEMRGGDPRIPEWANPFVKANGGLYIKAELDAGDELTPVAAQVRHLLRKRRVTQFSFAYEVLASNPGTEDGTTDLTKLWLFEVGPTPIGMHPSTELLSAKAAAVPAEDPPPEVVEEETRRGGHSAALFRLRCDIAAMTYAHQN